MKYSILLLSIFFSPIAHAAIVDFAPESGRFTDLGTNDGFFAVGSWREDGFDVGFRYENIGGDGLGGVADAFNAGPGLNDSGCCFGEFNFLTFSRSDAQPFSLREIDFGGTTASYYGEVEFIPFAADGSLDSNRLIRQQVDVAPANVVLQGRKNDGTEVDALVNSYFNSDFISGVGGPNMSFQNADPFVVDGDLALTLSDLAFLNVTVGGAYSLGRDRDESLGDILRTSLSITEGVDALFYEGFDQCFGAGQSVASCSLEDFGQFSFSYTTNVRGNYGSRVFFDSLTFDGEPSVAAVPLPATAPLLMAAVGLLGWRSRKTAAA